jgi:hydrogenase/urease accessory protein HupE
MTWNPNFGFAILEQEDIKEGINMKKSILLATAMALTASPAFAHLNPAEHGSFAAGFTHPLSGADHILAMVAVGLWAAMLGGAGAVRCTCCFCRRDVARFCCGTRGSSGSVR